MGIPGKGEDGSEDDNNSSAASPAFVQDVSKEEEGQKKDATSPAASIVKTAMNSAYSSQSKNGNASPESAHTKDSSTAGPGKVNMPPWLHNNNNDNKNSVQEQFETNYKKKYTKSPGSPKTKNKTLNSSNVSPAVPWYKRKSVLNISNHKDSKSNKLSNHIESTKSRNPEIRGVFIFRLPGKSRTSSASSESNSNAPECLAKYEFTFDNDDNNSSSTIKSNKKKASSTTTTSPTSSPMISSPSRKSPRKIKYEPKSSSPSPSPNKSKKKYKVSYLDTIVTMITKNPPTQSTSVLSQKTKLLQGYRIEVTINQQQVVYGADIDGICCALVTSKEYPSHVAMDMLQDVYTDFVSNHLEQIQDLESKGQKKHSFSEFACQSMLRSYAKRYEDPNDMPPAQPTTSSSLNSKPDPPTRLLGNLNDEYDTSDYDIDDRTVGKDEHKHNENWNEDKDDRGRKEESIPHWLLKVTSLKPSYRGDDRNAQTSGLGKVNKSAIHQSPARKASLETSGHESKDPDGVSRPEWMDTMTSLRSIRKDGAATITTRTDTTVSGTTATATGTSGQGLIKANVTPPSYLHSTPRSIILEENKNNSVQSTLGGSVNDDLEENDDIGNENNYTRESMQSAPAIWLNAKESLRATPIIETRKKSAVPPVSTKDNLRPTRQTSREMREKNFVETISLRPSVEAEREDDEQGRIYQESLYTAAHPKTNIFSSSPPLSAPTPTRNRCHTSGSDSTPQNIEPQDVQPEPFSKQLATVKKKGQRNDKLSENPASNPGSASYLKHLPSSASTTRSKDEIVLNIRTQRSATSRQLTNANENSDNELRKERTGIDVNHGSNDLLEDSDAPVRRPAISKFDYWHLTKEECISQGGNGKLDYNTNDPFKLSKPIVEVSLDDSHSLDASKSAGSDWGAPSQYGDESSWVNPTRPVDPERKKRMIEEVGSILIQKIEQRKQPTEEYLKVQFQGTTHDVYEQEKKKELPDANSKAGIEAILSAELATKPGSLSESLWSMPSKRRQDERAISKEAIIEEGWSMPSNTTASYVASRKADLNEKDYRYTYITARPASTDPASVSSYWDKIRQNYFAEQNLTVPTEGAQVSRTMRISTDDSVSADSLPWLPPGGIASNRPVELSRGLGSTLPPVDSSKSVVTSDSDWEPPVANRVHRVDFTGKIMMRARYYPQEDSDSSGNIPWVPNPDDFSSAGEQAEEEEGYKHDDPEDGLVASPPETPDSSSREEMSDESEFSSEEEYGTIYSSVIRFDDDSDDEEFIENPSLRRDDVENVEEAIKAVSRRPVLDENRSPTRQSSTGSMDSVPSRTGRISFLVEPELITFEDDPNEDRGSHYARIGRNRNIIKVDRHLQKRSKSNNQWVYYLLCCIMIIIPAVVLVVMFVFVLDVRENDDESAGGS